jgi:hypothetical protein
VRNGRRTTYREYLHGLTAKRPSRSKKHFWKRQDIGRIASDWADVIGTENVTVVTVPPRGADPSELWRRFARAMNLESVHLEEKTASNESLGLTGTELLRRINAAAEASDMSTWHYQHGINRALSHQVLPEIADPRPSLGVPDDVHEWVRAEAARMRAELAASGVLIVGDISDLEPQLIPGQPFAWPEDLSDSELLDFAVAALSAFGESVAERKKKDLESGTGKRKRGNRKHRDAGDDE